jgi:hypothetical protein
MTFVVKWKDDEDDDSYGWSEAQFNNEADARDYFTREGFSQMKTILKDSMRTTND